MLLLGLRADHYATKDLPPPQTPPGEVWRLALGVLPTLLRFWTWWVQTAADVDLAGALGDHPCTMPRTSRQAFGLCCGQVWTVMPVCSLTFLLITLACSISTATFGFW